MRAGVWKRRNGESRPAEGGGGLLLPARCCPCCATNHHYRTRRTAASVAAPAAGGGGGESSRQALRRSPAREASALRGQLGRELEPRRPHTRSLCQLNCSGELEDAPAGGMRYIDLCRSAAPCDAAVSRGVACWRARRARAWAQAKLAVAQTKLTPRTHRPANRALVTAECDKGHIR